MQKKYFTKINQLRDTTTLNRLENPPTGIPRYNINGEGYYSVTQILDDGKFAKIEPKSLLHSQILGSVVHLQIENYFKKNELLFNLQEALEENALKLFNFLPEPSDEDWETYLHSPSDPNNTVEELVLKKRISTAYDHFTTFLQEHTIEPIWSEEIIWSPMYLYAGTVDLFCYIDDKLAIIDHKTSRFIDETRESLDNYTGQLSAYANAIKMLEEEEVNIELNLLHLDPLGNNYKLIPRKYNFSVFLDAYVRFSQTKFLPNQEKSKNTEDSNEQQTKQEEQNNTEIDNQFKDKHFACPEKTCKNKSTFPFPIENTYLLNNEVKTIIKIAYHENNNHYAIFHVNASNLTLQKSFIYSRSI